MPTETFAQSFRPVSSTRLGNKFDVARISFRILSRKMELDGQRAGLYFIMQMQIAPNENEPLNTMTTASARLPQHNNVDN